MISIDYSNIVCISLDEAVAEAHMSCFGHPKEATPDTLRTLPWSVFLASVGTMSTLERPIILLIMGSVRAGRRCPQITEWVHSLADQVGQLACEIVDLKEWHLPWDDEPGIPAKGVYTKDHTRAWSAKVATADGFIIVSPQYNWGYPAALKNALDHLYKEWSGKPLVIVTYGGHGGDKCAQQLRQVAEGLKMHPVDTIPAITVAREVIENDMPQSLEDLKPFEASVLQALAEMNALLVAAK